MTHFQAVAWDGQDQDDQFTVRIFGRAEDGRSVSLGTKFSPFFYIKPRRVTDEILNFAKSKSFKAEVKQGKDLWGFQNGNLSKFIQVTFKSHRALRGLAWAIENGKYPEMSGCQVYEANIDPVLRFMHVSGIASTGWVDPGLCEPDLETTCDVNLWAPDWRLITPLKRDDIAPLRIMSFDIECFSSTGAFPDPRNPHDVVFQIGMTTRAFGQTEWIDRTCLCLKKTSGTDAKSFETERELLNAFQAYLVKIDPDIMTGWNIFGFDLEFLHFRAVLSGASTVWGRVKDCSIEKVVEKNLSSSALGNNLLKMTPMKGRYVFDLFQDVKREHKLESYSLNAVSKHFLKDQKLDMPVKEIFSRFREGDPDKLGEVAEYCIKDTELPHALMDKLCQIQNAVEMAKACWVPLAFLSERGQQIKVFSQMAYKARELNFIIPTFRQSPMGAATDEGYQGATVLDAQTGAYYNPITALDFASLYPSIMCAHNLCYSSLVMDPKYDNLPGVEYEQFGAHRFAQSTTSLLPTILMDLKAFRKKAKKLMAAAEGTPMEAIYNGQQLAYKISMNSIYGFTGASKGMLPLVAIASTVTMRGRQMIEETKNYVEEHFPGAKVRYGDSVMPDTPVFVRHQGTGACYFSAISALATRYESYEGFKAGDSDRTQKEQNQNTGLDAWTNNGWKPIMRVIRHKCKKRIFRITTSEGCVDVTEDHSLLSPSGEILKPVDVNIGRELMHNKLPNTPVMEHACGKHVLDAAHSWMTWKTRETIRESLGDRRYVDAMNAVNASYIYHRLTCLGFKVTITDKSHDVHFSPNADRFNSMNQLLGLGSFFRVRLTWTDSHTRGNRHSIKTMHVLHESWDGYVYDLETEAGTFQAGVGQMIVKNTDSVMVEFDVQGRKGQEAIDYSWEQGELAAEQCTKLFKAPNDLELEKVYCPYFLYSKKRYAAKMYEKKGDAVVFKKIDVKGLQVVRRDSCPFVRETLKKLLGMVLESSDPMPVIDAARDAARVLMNGQVPIEKLLMSKQLASAYKVPMPHVAVRDKIKARAPGSEPQQGDRVPFVIIKGDGKMYEKAEDPVWVRDNNLSIDFNYYFTNQFKKPVQDLLEPLVSSDVIFDKRFMAKTGSTAEISAKRAFLARFAGALKVTPP